MRITAIVFRIIGVVAVIAAVAGQLTVSVRYWSETGVRDLATSFANFFSFFTVQSNLIAALALGIGAVVLLRGRAREPRGLTVLRACATSYLVTTGIVYNVLLRGVERPPDSWLPWSNEVLHVAMPLLMLLDWIVAPGRNRLRWRLIGVIVAYPLLWAVGTMVRGPLVFSDVRQDYGWYPYPFIDPANGGYGSVAVFVLIIAALIAAAGTGVIALSRSPVRLRMREI